LDDFGCTVLEMSSRSERFLVDNSAVFARPSDLPRNGTDVAPSLLDRLKLNLTSDEELVARLQEGKNDALTVLFERYSVLVFRHARRVLRNDAEAEDLAQQVFLDLLRSVNHFDGEKASFKTWLMMFAYCRIVSRWRQLQSRHYYDSESLEEVLPAILEGAQKPFPFHTAEAICLVEQALGLVQPRQRRTIELIYYEGLTPEEVAQQTGESVSVVRHNLYRGLEKVRSVLGEASMSKTASGSRKRKSKI
jgi:RNA polymerase sigma-70 factor (ECF subfamily)